MRRYCTIVTFGYIDNIIEECDDYKELARKHYDDMISCKTKLSSAEAVIKKKDYQIGNLESNLKIQEHRYGNEILFLRGELKGAKEEISQLLEKLQPKKPKKKKDDKPPKRDVNTLFAEACKSCIDLLESLKKESDD